MRNRPGHWLGPFRLLLLTREGRRVGDPGAVLRAVAHGESTAVGGRVRGLRFLLLLDPALAGELLTGHAGDTVKSPGLRRTRGLLGDGLLTSEGDAHLRARRLVAPAFSPRRLAGYADGFAERTAWFTGCWRDGDVLDMRREMARLTLDIVGGTLLGIELREDADNVRDALEAALDAFAASGQVMPLARRGELAARPAVVGGALRSGVDAVVGKIVEARRDNPSQDRGDVVSALLAAMAGPDGLTMTEVHDHVITLLMAGHETTANALSWTLYLLSGHPEAERALHAELDGLDGALPGYADLGRLPYTRAVVAESMRLYPPAWIITRALVRPAELGGWHAPAGTIVAVSPLLLHHDARWFPEPERFDPARWLDARKEKVPRHAYLPFGTGPRACIGEQFAWAEATLVLAVICSRWTARPVPGQPVRPQYRVTLRPSPALPMELRARSATSHLAAARQPIVAVMS